MKKAEADIVRGAVMKLEAWMNVETEVIVTGKRPEVAGATGQQAIRADAMNRRDEMFELIRQLRPLAVEGR